MTRYAITLSHLIASVPRGKPGFFKIMTLCAYIVLCVKQALLIIRGMGIMTNQTSPGRQRGVCGFSGINILFMADKTQLIPLPENYIAFPHAILPDIERIIKRAGYVVKTVSDR